ncbi:hypothetical protein KP509_02G088000 [Ceratopteris richardii]|uniref:Protein kinase domain-containing protein n=1 Tax=Ceratopteris richardii TaxID=49495 RepID=A0A8T2VGF4_CERRI|nr:hypothetical protein KP509_02G088000 [Ceratopteris richardii]
MGNCVVSLSDQEIRVHNRSSSSTFSPPHSQDQAAFKSLLLFSTRSDLGSFYDLGPELGRGQYGIIRRCRCRSSGSLFACKSISKECLVSPQDTESIVREVRIMKCLSNPANSTAGGILRLHEVIEDKIHIHLILELCQGGDLYESIAKNKRYSEVRAASIMKSLLESLQVCHRMGIMHRDIKPENILLIDKSDNSDIKLADFGLSLEFSKGQKFAGLAGSSYYIAPEILQGEYSEEIDIWSAGVIMYIILSGAPPFWGATEQRIYKAIQKGDLRFSSKPWDEISMSAKDLIGKMLHPDPKCRIPAAGALSHPWILYHTQKSCDEQPH